MPERMLTTKEVADLLCITRRTLNRWIHLGKVPKPINIGRKNLWKEADIKALIEDASSKASNSR